MATCFALAQSPRNNPDPGTERILDGEKGNRTVQPDSFVTYPPGRSPLEMLPITVTPAAVRNRDKEKAGLLDAIDNAERKPATPTPTGAMVERRRLFRRRPDGGLVELGAGIDRPHSELGGPSSAVD